MVSAPLVCGPYSLHTAGEGSPCRNNNRIIGDHPAYRCKSCRLSNFPSRQPYKLRNRPGIPGLDHGFKIFPCIGNLRQPLHLLTPNAFCIFDFPCVGRPIHPLSQFSRQCLYSDSGIPHSLDRVHLICVEFTYIDGHKLYIIPFE